MPVLLMLQNTFTSMAFSLSRSVDTYFLIINPDEINRFDLAIYGYLQRKHQYQLVCLIPLPCMAEPAGIMAKGMSLC
jgi:hypothetical protein